MSHEDQIFVGYSNGKKGCKWHEDTCSIQSFEELDLVPKLQQNVNRMYKTGNNAMATPLPIQRFTLKAAMAGDDINCLSATGIFRVY